MKNFERWLTVQEVDGMRTSNGIQYRLQLLFSNGELANFSTQMVNPVTFFQIGSGGFCLECLSISWKSKVVRGGHAVQS